MADRLEHVRCRRSRHEGGPAALCDRILAGASRRQCRPVHRLVVDVQPDIAHRLRHHESLRMQRSFGGIEQHDRRPVVAALLHQLLRFGRVWLRPAGVGEVGRIAHVERGAVGVERGVVDIGAQRLLLIHQMEDRLAQFGIVERRDRLVEPHHALQRGEPGDTHLGIALQQRHHVRRNFFKDIDFAGLQRIERGLRVGDDHPFDAIDIRHLSAGEAARRVLARHIGRRFDVDHLRTW